MTTATATDNKDNHALRLPDQDSNVLVNRDSFLSAGKRRYANVTIEDFGTVRIRNISEGEQAKIESQTLNDNKKSPASGMARWRSRFIIAAVVDANNHPLFNEQELETILAMDTRIANELYNAISAHCGTLDDTEDLEKN